MKILLSIPSFQTPFGVSNPRLKFTQTLGLLTVAAMFPAQWERRLVDLNEEQECGRNHPDHSIMGKLHTQR